MCHIDIVNFKLWVNLSILHTIFIDYRFLNRENFIGEEGALFIGKSISKLPKLKNLDLDLRYDLKFWILFKIKVIVNFIISFNKIGSQGVFDLGKDINKCPSLISLRLNLQ